MASPTLPTPRLTSAAFRAALPVALLATAASAAGAQRLTPPDSGARCRWMTECSAPGAALTMAERSRTGSGRTLQLVVSPQVSGLPVGVPLTLWMRRTGEGAQWVATGYALDGAGRVGCADRAQHAALAAAAGTGWCPVPLEHLTLEVGAAMEGEAFDFAVSTADGRHTAYATVVPRPLVASTAGCGTLEGRPLDARAQVLSVRGGGFPPRTVVRTVSTRGRETVTGQVTTDSTGRFLGVVTGAGRGGEASYTVRADSCEVTLPYRWGRAAGR